MTDLVLKVNRTISRDNLASSGDHLLVAVSGGLDSVSLLHILRELRPRWNWKLSVAHFNHRLRGQESEEDEAFVRRMSDHLSLPFFSEACDVKAFCRKEKASLEMGARRLRHEFLAATAKRIRASAVVLGHHGDDQIETFFLRLFRGAGPDGLAGMRSRSCSPVDPEIRLVRPLLTASRAELLEYAKEARLEYREDSSNQQMEFRRNRIRKVILPFLRKETPHLDKTIRRAMDIFAAQNEVVQSLAHAWEEAPDLAYKDLPSGLQQEIILRQLHGLGKKVDADLIERLRTLERGKVSAGGTFLRVTDAGQVVESQAEEAFGEAELAVELKETGTVDFDGATICWERLAAEKTFRKPKPTKGQEYFDAEKVGRRILLRHWRAGDRFQPIGSSATVKLQDLFTNLKIPRASRRKIILAAAESGEIFWVEGLRIGERFKLDKTSGRRLKWQWRRNSFEGDLVELGS